MDQSIGDIRIDYVVSRIIVIDKKVRDPLYRYEICFPHMHQSGSGCGVVVMCWGNWKEML